MPLKTTTLPFLTLFSMQPSEAILILRNTGHTAELPRFVGDSHKVDGQPLTREELLTLASDQDLPDLLL